MEDFDRFAYAPATKTTANKSIYIIAIILLIIIMVVVVIVLIIVIIVIVKNDKSNNNTSNECFVKTIMSKHMAPRAGRPAFFW